MTQSVSCAVLTRSPVRFIPHGSSVTTGGNRTTRRKLGRVKLDNTLLTCDRGNFNQITARSRNQTLVTVVRDTCITTVPPAPRICIRICIRMCIRISIRVRICLFICMYTYIRVFAQDMTLTLFVTNLTNMSF